MISEGRPAGSRKGGSSSSGSHGSALATGLLENPKEKSSLENPKGQDSI